MRLCLTFLFLTIVLCQLSQFTQISLRIKEKNTTECLDVADATNLDAVTTTPCVKGKPSQLFSFDKKKGFIHLNTTKCMEGSPCCLEHFFGEIGTIWSCSDPKGKVFKYNASTGLLSAESYMSGDVGCLESDGQFKACSTGSSKQVWNFNIIY